MTSKMGLSKTIILFLLIVAGCASNSGKAISPQKAVPTGHETQNIIASKTKNISHITQCTHDIESLRTVDAFQYRRFLAEYDALMKSSEGFLTVKDDVSPEVAALARPRFQFALVNLCWRVKNALAQSLIDQAGGGR